MSDDEMVLLSQDGNRFHLVDDGEPVCYSFDRDSAAEYNPDRVPRSEVPDRAQLCGHCSEGGSASSTSLSDLLQSDDVDLEDLDSVSRHRFDLDDDGDPDVATDGGRDECGRRSCNRPGSVGFTTGRGQGRVRCRLHALVDAVDGIGESRAQSILSEMDFETLLERCSDADEAHAPPALSRVDGLGPTSGAQIAVSVDESPLDEDSLRDVDQEAETDGGHDLNDQFWTIQGPSGEVEAFQCPECNMTQTAEGVRERGGCDSCEFELPDDFDDPEVATDGGRTLPAQRSADWTRLSAFQRDVLAVIATLDREPYGLAIKAELQELYSEEVNHGRLYPNLNKLVDQGLVEKGQLDRRTNSYELSDEGREVLHDLHEWIDCQVGHLDGSQEVTEE